ncbi:hypothetical protein MBLNU457_g2931t1 [Dothideomycetes sp. NU457]
MVGNDNQQPQQQVRRNPDDTFDQAGLQALIQSPPSSSASNRHGHDSTNVGDASAQSQAQSQPPLTGPQDSAPQPASRRHSSGPTPNAHPVYGGHNPTVAELQDLGRRWFAFGCAMASYREDPRQWRVAPSHEHYLGPDQRRWLQQMWTTTNPSPSQLERYALLRNVVYHLERSSQVPPSYFHPPPPCSAQASQTPREPQAAGAPRAPQQTSAAQANQVSRVPQAHRPSTLELIWAAPTPSTAIVSSMPASGTVAGGPRVPIFPRPPQYQNLSTTPHAGANRADVVAQAHPGMQMPQQRQAPTRRATTPSGTTQPQQHGVNGGMYRTIQPAPTINRSAPQAQQVIHQAIPRPILNPSAMLHSAVGPVYPPRHPQFWNETGSLLRREGDARFMELSWMDPGRQARPIEGRTVTGRTTVTGSAPQILPTGRYRTTSPSAQAELPAVAAALWRSTTERRAVGSEHSDRSPRAKRVRLGPGPEDDYGTRTEMGKNGL